MMVEAAGREVRISSPDKVFFPGFISQNQLRELFYQSHIFLHPSEVGGDGNQEGIPNSMLEAMASGVPVVTSRIPPFTEYLGDEDVLS